MLAVLICVAVSLAAGFYAKFYNERLAESWYGILCIVAIVCTGVTITTYFITWGGDKRRYH